MSRSNYHKLLYLIFRDLKNEDDFLFGYISKQMDRQVSLLSMLYCDRYAKSAEMSREIHKLIIDFISKYKTK